MPSVSLFPMNSSPSVIGHIKWMKRIYFLLFGLKSQEFTVVSSVGITHLLFPWQNRVYGMIICMS